MARQTVAAMLLVLVFLAAVAGPAQLEHAQGQEEEIVPEGFGTCDYGMASISYPEGWIAPCEVDGHVTMSPDGVAEVLITPFWAGEEEDVSLREMYDAAVVEMEKMWEFLAVFGGCVNAEYKTLSVQELKINGIPALKALDVVSCEYEGGQAELKNMNVLVKVWDEEEEAYVVPWLMFLARRENEDLFDNYAPIFEQIVGSLRPNAAYPPAASPTPTPPSATASPVLETATATPTPAPATRPTPTPLPAEGEWIELGPIEEEGNEYAFSFELPEGYNVVEKTQDKLTAQGPLIGIGDPSPDELRVITVETPGEGTVTEAARQWAEAGCPEEERPEIVAEGTTSLGETDGYFAYRACLRETTTGPVPARLDLVVLIAPGGGRFVGLTADHRLSDFAWSELTPGEWTVAQVLEIGGRPADEVHQANLDAILTSLAVSVEDHGASQTEFVGSVPGPDEISTDPEVIGTNVFLALFVILAFAFTSTLFNQTLDENRREIEGWVGRFFTPFRRLTSLAEQRYVVVTERRPGVQRMAGPAVILLLTGLVYGFLSPDFGFNTKSVVLFASLVLGVGAITYVYEGGQALFTTRRFRLGAGVKLYAVALAIAAGCVLLSRLVDFQPGFLYGFVAAYTLLAPAALDRRQSGQVILFPAIALLAFSVIAWILVIPLREVTQGSDAWWVALPEGAAVAVFVVGLEGLFFNMIPLSFMDGAKMAEWNRLLWFLMFGVAGFLFWHVLLNQEGAYLDVLPEKRVVAALSLLVFYSIITLVTWAYFRGRVYGWAMPSMATVRGTVVGWVRGAVEQAERIRWRRGSR